MLELYSPKIQQALREQQRCGVRTIAWVAHKDRRETSEDVDVAAGLMRVLDSRLLFVYLTR